MTITPRGMMLTSNKNTKQSITPEWNHKRPVIIYMHFVRSLMSMNTFRHIYKFCHCGVKQNTESAESLWSGDQNDQPQNKQRTLCACRFSHLRNSWYQTDSKRVELCMEYVRHNGASVILSSPNSEAHCKTQGSDDSCVHDHTPEQ